jgi:hypothetical protein
MYHKLYFEVMMSVHTTLFNARRLVRDSSPFKEDQLTRCVISMQRSRNNGKNIGNVSTKAQEGPAVNQNM